QALLDELVSGDGTVLPLLPALGVVERRLIRRHGAADRAPRNTVAGLSQAGERTAEALDVRQDVLCRNPAVLERELGGDRSPQRHLPLVLERREPFGPLLDQETPDDSVELGPDERDVG